MEKSFAERIETYPELKEHIEEMLDIVENIEGKANRADDAEIQVVDNIRKMGGAALQEWASQRERLATSEWALEHPTSTKHGKKKSGGQQLLENEKS